MKTCTFNLDKPYYKNCNHEIYYHDIMKTCINKFDTMKLCLSKWYHTLLWFMGYKFCDNMSRWKTKSIYIYVYITCTWPQKIKPHKLTINTKSYIVSMKRTIMILCLCNWYYFLFELVSFKFCDNMSPWKFSFSTIKKWLL